MSETLSSLRIEIGLGPDTDVEELAELSMSLRDELLELDVETADQVVGDPAPLGAKGPAGDAVGTLVVTLSNSAVLVALASVLGSWISRDRRRKITIRRGKEAIEVSGASEEEQARLIAAWLDRHARL